MRAALLSPLERNPLRKRDGSMACVAANCDGQWHLRELLEMVESKSDKAHVLGIVAKRRETTATRLSERERLLAAVDFLKKPEIKDRPRQAVDEYLMRQGIAEDVVAEARRLVDEDIVPLAGGQSHAPAFASVEVDSAAAEEIDAIEAELIAVDDLASVLRKIESTKKKATKRVLRNKVGERAKLCAAALDCQSWACLDGFAGPDLVDGVLRDVACLEPLYAPSEIWVGTSATLGAQVVVPEVRGDKVLWMCGAHPGRERGGVEPCDDEVKRGVSAGVSRLSKSQEARFQHLRDLMRSVDGFVLGELVPRLGVLSDVSSRSDAMLAVYPGDGARFQAHVDNTSLDGRKLTTVLYLNKGWTREKGGQLRIHATSKAHYDVEPRAGRLALFYADRIKHEVRPTWHQDRVALTLWYYGDNERRDAVDRAKVDAATEVAVNATDAERRRAQAYARDLCDPAHHASVEDLADRAEYLPRNSQKILAAMAGVPDTHFAVAVRRMTPDALNGLRTRFATMGV
ncbi:hypothetical protein CTAYLR_005973 [Chrysophaeum taylorii]|uniref:Fe2OG dioxygenase domain-containing protein n=1 Tax=Chrysophaeum taylorii TaxID=2483200 RepID=A0AAD7UK88_9STRA|nr:hypothetical protein CTAYLR_005973 [Chrysophaeum taylorii]